MTKRYVLIIVVVVLGTGWIPSSAPAFAQEKSVPGGYVLERDKDAQDLSELREYMQSGLVRGLKFYCGYEPFYATDPAMGPNLLDPLKSQGVLKIEDSVMVIRWAMVGGRFSFSVQDRGPGFESSRTAMSGRLRQAATWLRSA